MNAKRLLRRRAPCSASIATRTNAWCAPWLRRVTRASGSGSTSAGA